MKTLTVIPEDGLICVDGQDVHLDSIPAPSNLHALQWQGDPENGSGWMEFTDDMNIDLWPALFEEEVAPYLKLFEEEKARLEKEFGTSIQDEISEKKAHTQNLLAGIQQKLFETLDLVAPDSPISEEDKKEVLEYRKALRELAEQPGAPWDGGGPETPWPPVPEVAASMM